MEIQENVPLGNKTTMRIGGIARYFADLSKKEEVEEVIEFAQKHDVPIVMLGAGANTIFADETINALVIRIKANSTVISILSRNDSRKDDHVEVTIEAGKNLPMLINELAKDGYDLSALTGIPGTVGGAIFGNAGQGPKGIWMDHFVSTVTAYINGKWKEFPKKECAFEYRGSVFKKINSDIPPIIWSVRLQVPTAPSEKILKEIERLLQRRLKTQPHTKTAGSCFKAVGDTPAWQLIDAAGLRGKTTGGVQISKKHANFLLNDGTATFKDAVKTVETVQQTVSDQLEVEMRFIDNNGMALFSRY